VALGSLVMPVSAEHGLNSYAGCPTGSAEIVLDPGHGGSDSGAIQATYGLQETVLTLEIAERTAAILQEGYGYRVALTRETNETELGNSERGSIANACGARVFVEIHLNASFDPGVDYAQTFWSEKEKDLAFSLMMNDALSALGIPVTDVDRFDNGGLLRAKMPSVLVEAVFVSNINEAKDLANGTRQEGIARAIATGVGNWMRLRV
jgi:N-acetylmuramoyl-L-alanine amidase